jgi:beta-glucosidase-like glycosyl hydrolase
MVALPKMSGGPGMRHETAASPASNARRAGARQASRYRVGRLRLALASLVFAMSALPTGEGASNPNDAGRGAEDLVKLPYMNPSLPPEQRAMDLVHRMTLQEKASQLVNQARAIPRLGVPAYDWWSEALHGVLAKGTTEFPQPIALAATFDVPAIREMATAIGVEGRIKHAQAERDGHSNIFEGLDFWAPNVNIFRDPRWGRGHARQRYT